MHTLSQTHSSTSSSPPTPPSFSHVCRTLARSPSLCVVLDRCVESGLRSLRPSATRLLRLAVFFRVSSPPHVVRLASSAARSRCEAASRVAQTNHALTSLNVEYNWIGAEGASALARALEVRRLLS